VVAGLQEDIDEIENDVFDGTAHVSRRIYDLAREVIQFQRATKPLDPILKGLMDGAGVSEEETRYLRDVEDHAIHIEEQVSGFRELLQNIVNVNLTLETKALSEAANTTNVEVQKISAWAAIFFAPTLIGTIYGMNFKDMPELHWALGYPYALSLMVVLSVGLYILFRRRGWI
jgi:magnesium transporter